MNATAPPSLSGLPLVAASLGIAIAGFMNVLDTTIAVVALPTIAGNLAATPSQASWVLTIYGVCLAVVLPLSGWITHRYGLVRTFIAAVVLFTLTSWLCAAARSFDQLLAFRAAQGIAGGLLLPLSQSLLMRIYPPERHGVALGVWGVTSAVAPVAGPLLGGYITDSFGWEWIFYINVPFGVASAYLCWALVRPFETPSVRLPVDTVGLALLVVGVISGQLVLDRGHELDWLASPEIRVLAVTGLVCFVLFLAWERDAEHPIVDLSLLRHRGFAVGTALVSLFYAAFVVTAVIYPLWIQTVLGYTARWSGIVMAPTSLFPLIAMPFIGHYVRAMDPRPVVSVGMVLMLASLAMHATATTTAPAGHLASARAMIGLGMPLVWMPLMMATLVGLPPEKLNSATGLFNFARMLASSMGTAAGITLWDERAIVHRARLLEEVSRDSVERTDFLQTLGAALPEPGAALAALDALIQGEARTLALQDLILVCAATVAAVGLLAWALPRRQPGQAVTAEIVHD
jgi:DHA2 family multidrug resistance protein